MYSALLLEEVDGKVRSAVKLLDEATLPKGDVTISVEHSTLNYKDGLVITGRGRLVKTYPHVPGIDFAGTVRDSAHAEYRPGDKVILTGWHVGERHWGGHAQLARVNGDWLVPLPAGLTTADAMSVGTAGLTAMLSIMALEEHGCTPDSGEVLVTGAAGGVGSVCIAILAKLGYRAVGLTGRSELSDFLTELGASEILPRTAMSSPEKRPLESERWSGCVDAVGGVVLARALAQMKYRGSVAAVGLAGGTSLETTVIPFLLRGVNLLGIDSVLCPTPRRLSAWSRIARDLPREKLAALTVHAALSELPALAEDILAGKVRGRVVVDVAR